MSRHRGRMYWSHPDETSCLRWIAIAGLRKECRATTPQRHLPVAVSGGPLTHTQGPRRYLTTRRAPRSRPLLFIEQ